jgi:hypothetical protein
LIFVATRGEKNRPRGWKGQEVENKPDGAPTDGAERAADRAEGNRPVRADAAAPRPRADGAGPAADDAAEDEGERESEGPTCELGDGDTEPIDPDGKTAEAADEHAARRTAGERPPRGKL